MMNKIIAPNLLNLYMPCGEILLFNSEINVVYKIQKIATPNMVPRISSIDGLIEEKLW